MKKTRHGALYKVRGEKLRTSGVIFGRIFPKPQVTLGQAKTKIKQ